MMVNDESRPLAGTRLGVVGKGGSGKSLVIGLGIGAVLLALGV